MPFHVFGPPHVHLAPIILSSALAFAGGAYLVARHGVPARIKKLGARCQRGNASIVFSRASDERNSSGNSAFNDYRAATLRQLEQEGADFRAYLDGLRHAKDKTEFDAFLKDRQQRDFTPPSA